MMHECLVYFYFQTGNMVGFIFWECIALTNRTGIFMKCFMLTISSNGLA